MADKPRYITIALPSEIVAEVDTYVGTRGFSSRTEVVKDALRDFFAKNSQHKNGLEKLTNAET